MTKERIRGTHDISRIKEMIDNYGFGGDSLKLAVEIYSALMEDKRVCPYQASIICSEPDCNRTDCAIYLRESGELAHSVTEAYNNLLDK